MATNYSNHIATYTAQHNTHVFDNIGKAMDKLVREKTKERTRTMIRILRHREPLISNTGNWGQFPLGEGKGTHAHTQWRSRATKDGFMIFNEHRNDADGYPYVRNLVAGTGWSDRVKGSGIGGVKADGSPSRLIRYKGRIFSSQMPHGLSPWLLRQRELLKQDIKLASGDKIIRGGKMNG